MWTNQLHAGKGDRLGLTAPALHPAWLAFIEYCAQLVHGEIERLKIQDGLLHGRL